MSSIYRLLIELVGKDRGATRALKSTQKELGGLERAAGSLQGALTAAAGIAGMAYMGRQALDLVGDLYMLGAQAMRTETAFRDLAKGAGGSADAILSAIKKASGGTVSEMTAMAAANRGILLGLGASADQWEELTEVARYRARAMGLTVTQALDDITTGIGRESRMILDNLGIVLDMDAVMSQYADTLGKTATQLDAFERKQAIISSVIQETNAQATAAGVDLGNMVNDQADDIALLATEWENLKLEVGKAVAAHEPLVEQVSTLASVMQKGWAVTFIGNLADAAEAGEVWASELLDLIENTNLFKTAVLEVTGPMDTWVEKLEHVADAEKDAGDEAASAAPKVHALARAYMHLADETKEWVAERTFADLAGMDPYEMDPGGASDAIIQQIEDIDARQEQNLEDEERRAKDWERAWKDARAARTRAFEDLKSTVEAALQPTSVTALDVQQTAMGTYADKWDEDARRLDAIAARGFAELDAHPDWAEILGIPPEILGSTEEVLKDWARQQSDNFRNLLLPLGPEDVAAAVERVRDYIQQQAQREQNIETIALAYQAQYGGTLEDARAAMGDTDAIGGIAADDVIAGFTDALEASSPAAQFQSYFKDDIEAEQKNLNTRGTELWNKIENGLMDEMKKGNYVAEFARILAPYVLQEIRVQATYAAGEGGP